MSMMEWFNVIAGINIEIFNGLLINIFSRKIQRDI